MRVGARCGEEAPGPASAAAPLPGGDLGVGRTVGGASREDRCLPAAEPGSSEVWRAQGHRRQASTGRGPSEPRTGGVRGRQTSRPSRWDPRRPPLGRGDLRLAPLASAGGQHRRRARTTRARRSWTPAPPPRRHLGRRRPDHGGRAIVARDPGSRGPRGCRGCWDLPRCGAGARAGVKPGSAVRGPRFRLRTCSTWNAGPTSGARLGHLGGGEGANPQHQRIAAVIAGRGAPLCRGGSRGLTAEGERRGRGPSLPAVSPGPESGRLSQDGRPRGECSTWNGMEVQPHRCGGHGAPRRPRPVGGTGPGADPAAAAI